MRKLKKEELGLCSAVTLNNKLAGQLKQTFFNCEVVINLLTKL